MTEKLHINSVISVGENKGKKICDIVTNKKAIFNLIKQGVQLDDEVLLQAGIKKTIRNVKVEHVFVEHETDNKVYEKETTSLQKILKEIRTLDDNAVMTDEISQSTDRQIENSNDYDEINIDEI